MMAIVDGVVYLLTFGPLAVAKMLAQALGL